MITSVLSDATTRMDASVSVLQEDLAAIRTGRASSALVEKLEINYYEQPTPLIQLATISVPEPRLLAIRPFDASIIKDIERAIQASDLGLTPTNDGKMIRISIPTLTEERRLELTRIVGSRVEEARVSVRNVRRDTLNSLRGFSREKLISEDEFESAEKTLEKETGKYIDEINQISESKQEEIMKV